MCLILTSNGKEIPKAYLQNGWDGNWHGAGFSYFKDGKLNLEKGFFKFEDLYEAYKKVIGNPIIIHLRWKTSGLQDKDNCHPFEITQNLHFCHNGVISYYNHKIKDKSDTFAYCEMFLKPIALANKAKKWWKNKSFKWWIENSITSSSKLAMIDNKGEITIFNESSGKWTDEEKQIWASNTSYDIVKTRITTNYSSNNENFHKSYPSSNISTTRSEIDFYTENEEREDRLRLQQGEDTIIDIDPNEEAGIFENEVFDITKIPDLELEEVDRYLSELNQEN